MIRLAFVAMAWVVVAACGSAPTPTPIGVCTLVPDMDGLVGKTAVGVPGSFTLNDVDRCIWTYNTDPARSVGVSLGPLRGHTSALENLGEGETVAGMGDDARWFEGHKLLSIAVGQRALQVDLQLADGENTKDLALAIGEAALANVH